MSANKKLSGQKTVTTAGTAVQLGTGTVNGAILIKALPTNTGVIYVGNSGSDDVDSTNGYPLSANEFVLVPWCEKLEDIWVDASVNTQKVSYLIIEKDKALE